jgi:SAM-dependent methyltransferase
MTVRADPEQNETRALLSFVDLDGRLTWRYADWAAHVTAVEPFAPAVARAGQNVPPDLSRRVVLRRAAFEEFAAENAASSFDVAIFSWSLCCMDQDDMVPALEEARRLIGPNGTVIDIHPVPGTAEVEIHLANEVIFAEPASTSDHEGERRADEALATVVARGLFVAERRSEFDFRVYASSACELRDFLAEADAHASPRRQARWQRVWSGRRGARYPPRRSGCGGDRECPPLRVGDALAPPARGSD